MERFSNIKPKSKVLKVVKGKFAYWFDKNGAQTLSPHKKYAYIYAKKYILVFFLSLFLYTFLHYSRGENV